MNYELKKVLGLIKGTVVISIEDEQKVFTSGQEAADQLGEKYVVNSISAEGSNVVVVLKKDTTIPNDMNADWIKKHVAVYGKEPNPFDGV
jgi:uncharacterized protein GlcG (DUF336 family)